MKKSIALSFFIAAISILASCKKKDDPAPANTPAVNQPSTTAPSLNSGTNTSLATTTGNSAFVNLSAVVTDPQADAWTLTSVTSSNTTVAIVEDMSESGVYGFEYTGLTAGTATFTIVVTDAGGNANTLTYTLTVTLAPNAPTLNAGVVTTLYVQAGSNVFWNLSDKVTDPQGDNWTVTNVVSSNTNILTVGLDDAQIVEYAGSNAGTATMTVTLSDESNNTSTFTVTVGVTPKSGGGGGGGPK